MQRAQGCLLGQICGDALGSSVEFYDTAAEIQLDFPDGPRDMEDGGPFDTLAGQPTDDSEMALALARTLVEAGGFDRAKALEAYLEWFESGPFDCGETIAAALCGRATGDSQGNGALMRASPLGLFGAGRDPHLVAEWARQDAAITHPNRICQDANALFVMAIATEIGENAGPVPLYQLIRGWAAEMQASAELVEAVEAAEHETWIDRSGGKHAWVLVALQNALWQLLHAPNLEEAVINTAGRGGASGTNAAVCGALLGAVYGRDAVPVRWQQAVLNCCPDGAAAGQPRPKTYWPADTLELAHRLLHV
ncbi:MAG: ADP-ribosylglycohydrolase family protein [Rhodobacteraceae bacterium]|nr:ADP-ribosylglycohydrolase family protein [Paracoccaceae bacterium]